MEPILIVDDAPSNRKLTQRVLTAAGYDVRAVSDAGAALHAIAEFRPRLVITDLRLNGMDGLELTRRIKEGPASRDIVVIVVTGCDTEDDRRAAANAGCDLFIVKPIDTRTLPSVIQAQLVRRREAALPVAPLPSPSSLPSWAAPLCREFLTEGRWRCAALLETGAGAPEIRAAAHVWAGLGGTFGYPDISTLARRVYDRLGRPDSSPDSEVTAGLRRLRELFDQAGADSSKGASLTPEMEAMLRGRRIALTGLNGAASARLADALSGAGADVLDGAAADLPVCDLVIAGAAAADAVIGRPSSEKNCRLLLVGLPPGGPGPKALLAAANLDFVAEPWSVTEVLSRACHLLARGAAPEAVPSGSPTRIVIADDDPTILTLLQTTVQNSGMECVVAREGDEALQLVRSTTADAIVLDILMPNMDGLEVLAAIRNDQALRRVRVLMLSALQQETDIVRAFSLGADDYVTKPFSPVEVVARLKRLHRVAA
jgi:DNA-binding response OmpR family regulator